MLPPIEVKNGDLTNVITVRGVQNQIPGRPESENSDIRFFEYLKT